MSASASKNSRAVAPAAAAPVAATVPHSTAPVGRNNGLIARIAARYAVDADKMLDTLKATAFRQKAKDGAPAKEVTNEQMMALLVVADQYQLNPFIREIYAFPSEGGIVPIVGVDGWLNMINRHPQLESMEIQYAPDGTESPWIACIIQRKDRTKPTDIREYMEECYRDTTPWNSHPRRMLRHKAIIQCGRVAFGFTGIFDPDEAERILEASVVATQTAPQSGKQVTQAPRSKSEQTQAPAAEPPQTAELALGDQPQFDMAHLLAELDKAGIPQKAFLAKFDIADIAEFDPEFGDAAYAWIKKCLEG